MIAAIDRLYVKVNISPRTPGKSEESLDPVDLYLQIL
jgi:hypothetical protein